MPRVGAAGLRDLLVRRRALILTVVSFIAWGSFSLARDAGHPYGDLLRGLRTDHFSHMNTARLFPHAGLDIWRKPLRDSVVPLTEEQKAALPADVKPALQGKGEVFTVPGWHPDKPFISSWSHNPRFHPPGNMILTAPVAVLYHYTKLSFTWANKLLILLFLVYAHIAIYFFLQAGLGFNRFKPMGFLIAFGAYFEIIQRTLEGFYEAAVIVPLILCGRYLHQRRALPAILSFTVATNLHFRAFFFAPLFLWAIYMLINEEQWRDWKRREYVLAGLSAILGVISLGVFRFIWPFLRQMPNSNPANITANPRNVAAVTTLIVATGIILAFFLYARAWSEAVLTAWLCIMFLLIREALPWDAVTLLAWFGLPIAAGASKQLALVRDIRIAALLFYSLFVFKTTTLLSPTWLEKII